MTSTSIARSVKEPTSRKALKLKGLITLATASCLLLSITSAGPISTPNDDDPSNTKSYSSHESIAGVHSNPPSLFDHHSTTKLSPMKRDDDSIQDSGNHEPLSDHIDLSEIRDNIDHIIDVMNRNAEKRSSLRDTDSDHIDVVASSLNQNIESVVEGHEKDAIDISAYLESYTEPLVIETEFSDNDHHHASSTDNDDDEVPAIATTETRIAKESERTLQKDIHDTDFVSDETMTTTEPIALVQEGTTIFEEALSIPVEEPTTTTEEATVLIAKSRISIQESKAATEETTVSHEEPTAPTEETTAPIEANVRTKKLSKRNKVIYINDHAYEVMVDDNGDTIGYTLMSNDGSNDNNDNNNNNNDKYLSKDEDDIVSRFLHRDPSIPDPELDRFGLYDDTPHTCVLTTIMLCFGVVIAIIISLLVVISVRMYIRRSDETSPFAFLSYIAYGLLTSPFKDASTLSKSTVSTFSKQKTEGCLFDNDDDEIDFLLDPEVRRSMHMDGEGEDSKMAESTSISKNGHYKSDLRRTSTSQHHTLEDLKSARDIHHRH
ncbi:hypothetical protein BGZ46_009874 [Entomortierella lignicola]|nr:hypothetical protein BGZ46_009874 [Entomortierella lignicola]